jgi:hypothetical protein
VDGRLRWSGFARPSQLDPGFGRPAQVVTEFSDVRLMLDAAAELAGVSGKVETYGPSLILKAEVEGRACELAMGSKHLWVAVDTSWGMPEDCLVLWAPVNSYLRVKCVEDAASLPAWSGDSVFDASYCVVGPSAPAFVATGGPAEREALCRYEWLRPDVTWLDTVAMSRRRHIRATPPISELDGEGCPPLSGAYAAHCLRGALKLATLLEATRA